MPCCTQYIDHHRLQILSLADGLSAEPFGKLTGLLGELNARRPMRLYCASRRAPFNSTSRSFARFLRSSSSTASGPSTRNCFDGPGTLRCRVYRSANGGLMGKGRLEAFSDGVLAIIITIMVLELKVPHGESIAALAPLIPASLSYVLSFIYVGIYWN